MSINQNKESLLDIAQKAGMPKNLANEIIEAMGAKEFDYRSRYNIEAKRFNSDFANEIGFKNFYIFDKTLSFYDNNQTDLVNFIQNYAKDTQYKSANHFIINVPFKEANHLETLSCKHIDPSDADLMLTGNFVSEKTRDRDEWEAKYAEELNNLYKNRMVIAATTILIDMHRDHFTENLAEAHEISEALTDLSKLVLKSPVDSISDFYFLGDFIAAYERIIPAYAIGAMGAFNDISKAYEENGLSDIYDVFSSNLSALREQDEDYGFMGIEDENDLFITTANLPHFYDSAVNSDDVVFRQLTAVNGYHLDTLIQDKDSRVKKAIIEYGDNAARSQLMNDKDKEVMEAKSEPKDNPFCGDLDDFFF